MVDIKYLSYVRLILDSIEKWRCKHLHNKVIQYEVTFLSSQHYFRVQGKQLIFIRHC